MRFESTQDNSKYTNVITRSNRNSNNSLGLLLATAATTTTTSTKVFRRHMYLLIIALVALSPVSSESSIGCKIDPKVCDQSEFCLDDSYLGICVSRDDQPIKESRRSEALVYNTEEDRAPIRIHKYNIDDEYDQIDQDNNLEQNELVDIKRDNINDNYMDLERINLYSEKTKRRSKEPTLTEILNMASLSDMPKEEVESEEEPDEYYDKNLDLSNSLSDDLEDYNYEDLLVDGNSASNNNNKAKDNLIDLLFEATSPVEEAEANDYSSSDYSDYPDDYEGQDYEDDERSKRSAELVIDSPGLVLDSSNNLLLRPVLAEAAGEDENGNSFYEQDLVVNGVGLDQPQEISTLDTNTIGRIIDNLQKENDLIEEVIETAEVNNQESPIEAELDKAIEQELTEQDLEDAVEENKADSLDEALESAVDKFILDLKTGDESQSKVNQEEDRLVKKDAVEDQQEQHQSQDPSSYSDSDLGKSGHFGVIDPSWITIEFSDKLNPDQSYNVLSYIAYRLKLPLEPFLKEYTIQDKTLSFRFESQQVTSKELADSISNLADEIQKETGLSIVSCGIGQKNNQLLLEKVLLSFNPKSEKFLLITVVSCLSLVLIILVLLVVFLVRRRSQLKAKLANDLGHKYDFEKVAVSNDEESLISSNSSSNAPHNRFWLLTYVPFVGRKTDKCHPGNADPRIANLQDLCRMRMDKTNSMSKPVGEMTVNTSSEIHSSSHALVSPVAGPSANINSTPIRADGNGSSSSNNNKSDSTRSSTSSWSEEPINSVNMDITTGHVILSYMEEHLNEKNRLAKEWEALSQYEPDLVKCDAGKTPQNMTKNRYSNILPYDHTRVKLTENKDNDYINANFIIDDDPKNPAYIATQGPLIHTTSDFWQMVWEQGSVLIISLCRTVEYGSLKCNQFWPANGFELYDKFEIHLVSEHVWCEDYLVRNFFLKNLETSQTRTVTQFHFLTWPENGIPSNIKSILDFRRKVNKSYKGKSSPIIVHCNDGVGRTGTYVLIDMVLNKITKGAKEIDLAATLEFLRDQRFGMVKNKNQFEFSFAVVTEEVQNMLKALNHQ